MGKAGISVFIPQKEKAQRGLSKPKSVCLHNFTGHLWRLTTGTGPPPVDTDPFGPTEVGIQGDGLTHLLLVATVLLAHGIKGGWSQDLVALSKQF